MSAYPSDDDRLELAMDAITRDERECEKFANELLDCYREQLAELVTGAYGYADDAAKRFQKIMQACELRLLLRAERNLQARGF